MQCRRVLGLGLGDLISVKDLKWHYDFFELEIARVCLKMEVFQPTNCDGCCDIGMW